MEALKVCILFVFAASYATTEYTTIGLSTYPDNNTGITNTEPWFTTDNNNSTGVTTSFPNSTEPDFTTDWNNQTTNPWFTTDNYNNTDVTTPFPNITTPDYTTDWNNQTTEPWFTTDNYNNTDVTTPFPNITTPDFTTDWNNQTTEPWFTIDDYNNTDVTTPFPNTTIPDVGTETTTAFPNETTTWEPTPPEVNITYYLYNNYVRGNYSYNSSNNEVFNLDDEVGTVVLIHNHGENRFDRFSVNVLRAFEEFHNFNVFVMDWSQLSSTHLTALQNLEIAANDLSTFLETIRVSKGAANNRQVHLIGFGTGAHLAGNAASNLYRILPVGRVTGLNPTYVIDGFNMSHVLSLDDASYVEAIHTDTEFTGINSRVAHVDFYPNGGVRQPGCWSHACNHNRAWELFMASLQFDHHRGLRCMDMNQMVVDNCYGLPALGLGGVQFMKVPMLPGIYRLNTLSVFPF